MKLIIARNEEIRFGKNEEWSANVGSMPSTFVEGTHNVHISTDALEISNMADSRGEALVGLGEYLLALGRRLKTMALEQEGCTGLTVGELAGSTPR